MVAMRANQIHAVWPGMPLDVLVPVKEALDLPGGIRHVLVAIPATSEAIDGEVLTIDEKMREGLAIEHGLAFPRHEGTLFCAEVHFRGGYGQPQLQVNTNKVEAIQDLIREQPWGERLGRLVRQSWRTLLDKAMDLAERAGRILDAGAPSAWHEEIRKPGALDSDFGRPLKQQTEIPKKPKDKPKGGIEF